MIVFRLVKSLVYLFDRPILPFYNKGTKLSLAIIVLPWLFNIYATASHSSANLEWNPCFLIKARRMASVLLRGICGSPQSSRMVIPHSASEGNTDFFAVLLVFSPTDHADFHRCWFTPPAKNLCLSAAPAVRSVVWPIIPHGICVALCDLWEPPIIPHGHSPFRIRRKRLIFNIPHY